MWARARPPTCGVAGVDEHHQSGGVQLAHPFPEPAQVGVEGVGIAGPKLHALTPPCIVPQAQARIEQGLHRGEQQSDCSQGAYELLC